MDQQFNANGQDCDLPHDHGRQGKNGTVPVSETERKDENEHCDYAYYGNRQMKIPSIARMQPSDDPKIHGNTQTIQKQAHIRIESCRKKQRQEKDPQNHTDPYHIKGPASVLENEQI